MKKKLIVALEEIMFLSSSVEELGVFFFTFLNLVKLLRLYFEV